MKESKPVEMPVNIIVPGEPLQFQLWKNCDRVEGLKRISTPFCLKYPEPKKQA